MNIKAVTQATPFARLVPSEEAHRAGLKRAATDAGIWTHWPFDVMAQGFDAWFDLMLARQAKGEWIPHTVLDASGQEIGQTCYLAIRPEHHGLEIGGTWYVPNVQGTKVNPACKLMMLDNAFTCGAQRVELKTNALNARSRAAMMKFGAQYEGVHRRHMLLPNGTWRDTAWYSVLADEWPAVKAELEARLGL